MDRHPVTGVDHLLTLTDDLDRAAKQFRRVGFTLSPRATHSPARGSANHTIMLAGDGPRAAYFELLGVVAATPANAGRRAALEAHGPGVHGVCGAVADLDAAAPALADRGIGLHNRGDFGRPVPLETGETADAAFANAVVNSEMTPFGILFVCEHRTPDLIWRPALMDHPNGAQSIAGVTAVSADPAATGSRLARLFRDGAATASAGGVVVETGATSPPIALLTPEAFATRFPGHDASSDSLFQMTEFRVADTEKTAAYLGAQGVSCVRRDGAVVVDPAETGGVGIVFI